MLQRFWGRGGVSGIVYSFYILNLLFIFAIFRAGGILGGEEERWHLDTVRRVARSKFIVAPARHRIVLVRGIHTRNTLTEERGEKC
jgi:hypothetical protein